MCKMRKKLLILAVVLTTLTACKNNQTTSDVPNTNEQTNSSTSNEDQIITVADHRQDCEGVGKFKCLLIKKDNAPEWSLFYSTIEGFEYEEGYEYQLQIRTETIDNPPADGSSIRYILVKQVSKVKKE